MDPERLGRLLDRYAAALERYAKPWCDAPEDVVQDAFVAMARLANAPETPGAWLFRAVRNGAINAGIAGKRRRRREIQRAVETQPWFDHGESDTDLDPDAAQDALTSLPSE